MEPRITRQTVRGTSQSNKQTNEQNKKMRKKKTKSVVKTNKKLVSNTSLQSSVVSTSHHRKRKCDQRIEEPKTKVAKASVPSTETKVAKSSVPSIKTKVAKASVPSTKTKVAKASVPSTKTKVAKASVPSTKTKVAKASVPSTKTKVAKASVPSTKTKIAKASVPSTKTKVAKASVSSTTTAAKKNKRNSKDSSILRTGKRERGRLSSLQHHRTRKSEGIHSKDIKPDSIKPKKTKTVKVRRQQRTHLKVTSLTINRMIKRKRSKALDLKSETQLEKCNIHKKKRLITKSPNKSRRQRLPSKDIQFDKTKETTEKTSFIRPYLRFDTNLPTLVSNICCVDQNTLWIGRMAYGSILKVTYNSSKTLTIVKEFKHPQCDFYDFCYDRNKDKILYTNRSNNSIMSISSNYKLKKFKCVKPLKPTCITISPDDFIFCGLVDEYSYQASPKREIVKMAKNGTVIMRIPSIHDNIVRFSIPHRIAIHPNNDIVIAGNDINGGVILMFDPEGQSKYPRTVTCPGVRFQPRGLTLSRAGDIVACNEANGEIYIYDVKGQLMETITSKSIGITDIPWSLAFDNCGHLVIGTMVNYQPNVPTICFAEYLYR